MDRKEFLLVAGVVSVLLLAGEVDAALGASDSGCANAQILAGSCNSVGGEIKDGGVTLTGNENSGGSSGPGSQPGGGQDSGAGAGAGGGSNSAGGGDGGVPPVVPAPPLRDGYGVTVTAPVTLSDIASFRPVPGTDHMQPNGWTIIGLSTNFYAVAAVQVQDGTLLGRAASVRFTPRSYHWAYGDGLAATRAIPGGTWRAQGIREFDPTPTSHVFTKRGSYTITLVIDFGAEYRYDGGVWTPIAGVIPLPANPLSITVGDAKTVLVAHDCGSNPRGPGC
jgi:hypothetical protein